MPLQEGLEAQTASGPAPEEEKEEAVSVSEQKEEETRVSVQEDGPKSQTSSDSDEDESDSSVESNSEPLVQKEGRDNSRFNLGLILALPLSVLQEICENLSVIGLFYLSRSNLELHSILLSRSFSIIWKRAFKDAKIPECPPDINEPQFLRLAFDRFCYDCGAPQIKKVDYGLRVRLCRSCSARKLVRGKELAKSVPEEVLRLCYFKGSTGRDRRTIDEMEYKKLSKKRFLAEDVERVAREYSSLLPGSKEQEEFIRKRMDLVEDICDHLHGIDSWLSSFYPSTNPEDGLKIYLRKRSIYKKLEDLGYTHGDIYVDRHDDAEAHDTWKESLEVPRELTERAWDRLEVNLSWVIRGRQRYEGLLQLRALHPNMFYFLGLDRRL